mgnify:FL=1
MFKGKVQFMLFAGMNGCGKTAAAKALKNELSIVRPDLKVTIKSYNDLIGNSVNAGYDIIIVDTQLTLSEINIWRNSIKWMPTIDILVFYLLRLNSDGTPYSLISDSILDGFHADYYCINQTNNDEPPALAVAKDIINRLEKDGKL